MAIGTTAAIIGAAAIGAGGSLAAGALGSKAAGQAASTQAAAGERAAELQYQASREALDFQKQVFGWQQQAFQPWLQTGTGALANLSHLMGIPFQQQAAAGGAQPGAGTTPSGGERLITLPSGHTVPLSSLMGAGGGRPLPLDRDLPLAGRPKTVQDFSGGSGGGGDIIRMNDLGRFPIGVSGPGATGGQTTDLSSLVNPELGEFGSLMQPFGEEFTAPTAETMQQEPGFQFRLQEGLDALQHSAAARGGLLTGATAEAITRYGQDYSSNEYQNVYNRALTEYQQAYNIFQQSQANQFNRLASMSGTGQTAAGKLSSAGTSAGGNIANILMGGAAQQGQALQNAAAARASGYVGSANAWGGALQGGLGNLSDLLLMQQLFEQQEPTLGTGVRRIG